MKSAYHGVATALFGLLPFFTMNCFAWSAGGHMVIAGEAWHELPAECRNKVTILLKSHPEYETWEKAFQPGPTNWDLATYVFMRASTWPDTIRRHGNKYDHPKWH